MTKGKRKGTNPRKVQPHERRLIEQSAHTIIALCDAVKVLCWEGHFYPDDDCLSPKWQDWQMEIIFNKASSAQLQIEVLMNILEDTE
jgi:hypothetical protein